MTLAEIVAKSMRTFGEIFDCSISFFNTKHLVLNLVLIVPMPCHNNKSDGVRHLEYVYAEMFTDGVFTDLGYFTGPGQPDHCSYFSHSEQVVFNMCRV